MRMILIPIRSHLYACYQKGRSTGGRYKSVTTEWGMAHDLVINSVAGLRLNRTDGSGPPGALQLQTELGTLTRGLDKP